MNQPQRCIIEGRTWVRLEGETMAQLDVQFISSQALNKYGKQIRRFFDLFSYDFLFLGGLIIPQMVN